MKRVIVVDTETGGLDPNSHSILTLGAAILELNGADTRVKSVFHMHIKEENVVTTPEALRINGLTEAEINAGFTPSFVVTAFDEWRNENGMYGQQMLAGHNVPFDVGFIQRLYRLSNKKYPFSYRVIDTQVIASALVLAGKLVTSQTSLDALTKLFGITIREGGAGGKHNAAEDALATARLLARLLHEINPERISSEVAVIGG